MRATLKYIFISILCVLLAMGSVFPCFSNSQQGSVTIVLQDKQQNDIDGMTVKLCQIAGIANNKYFTAQAFKNSGISIAEIIENPSESAAKTLYDYVINNNVNSLSATSNNGKAIFSKLDLGVWLAYSEKSQNYVFNPHIVFVPFETEGSLEYNIISTPKLDNGGDDSVSIYVIKKWDDNNNAPKKRPQSITVELVSGDTVIDKIQLSESNGWAYTFTNLAKDGEYSVVEQNVANYKPSYSGDAENGFVITNTYSGSKLPQTGQYWWPIVIFAIAGICFVLLGIYEIGVNKRAKKQ